MSRPFADRAQREPVPLLGYNFRIHHLTYHSQYE
jgi:hypothetical protein